MMSHFETLYRLTIAAVYSKEGVSLVWRVGGRWIKGGTYRNGYLQ